MSIKVVRMMCPQSKWNVKCPYEMEADGICVHNTANKASAKAEVSYMIGNNNEVSYHYAVDNNQVVQGIEENRNTWHAGDGNGKGNRKKISIEICYSTNPDVSVFLESEKLAAKFIAYKLKEKGWRIDRVSKHQDYNGKYCPHKTLDLGWERFLNLIRAELGEGNNAHEEEKDECKDENVNVYYRVRTQKHGWLPEVKNLDDYAGFENSPITDVAMKVDKGKIDYQVHVKDGGWLPKVSGYNINDSKNGYAGNGKVIDAIKVYYYTPSEIRPYKKAKYKANNYSWQYDTETDSKQDGYAGAFGVPITKLQIEIV